ncbi:rRNA-processing protein ebp2 [Ceratobasidium theobromae]|uniref:rRNA-processing protein ebp2 n=1 Tax=Ceratobasidium theobromae TaxID=1582974 RepID=A0A5N5QW58_9AGAM|nr:rRNA-processing protein ebp2 [Ceratobasidium theobromae]
MARTTKNFKLASKRSKPKSNPPEAPETPNIAEVAPTSTGVEADVESESDEDEEDSGVDEEGMAKLMQLLGEDGLDDVAEHQLNELGLGDAESGSNDESEDLGGDVDSGAVSVADDREDASSSGWVDEDEEMDGADGVRNQGAESDNEDGEEALPLDEVSDVEEDAVLKQKVVINNELALKRIRGTIELGKDMPWSETLAFTTSMALDIPNADDDLNRELAFYKQALDTGNVARAKFAAAKLPFSRPSDYFAEMVKSDSHMERIRQRLLDERAGIQKSETAKKQRELKKIGKQVQVEKLKGREKGRKEMNERVKGLKRKRGGALDAGQDSEAFDVAIEDAITDRPNKRGKPTMSRSKRDAKYGFGGAGTKGRRGKQNTKESTERFEFRGGMGREVSKSGGRGGSRNNRGGKRGAPKRLGKGRRQAGRT